MCEKRDGEGISPDFIISKSLRVVLPVFSI
jgi:hypothetical protein